LCVGLELESGYACDIDPTMAVYRKTTTAFLRKYFRMAVELGHLPSLLGREFFRTHVTVYGTTTFEDVVIFTHDVEKCLEKLDRRLQMVIARIVFQEYTFEETAELMQCSLRSIDRWHREALDRAAEIFLRHGLIEPITTADEILAECIGEDEEFPFQAKKPPIRASEAPANTNAKNLVKRA
jgi:hypothetical protein